MTRSKLIWAVIAAILLSQPRSPAQSSNPTRDEDTVISALNAVGPNELDRGLQIIGQNTGALSAHLCQELLRKANTLYRSSDFGRSALFFELAREAAVRSANKAVLVGSSLHRLGLIYFDRETAAKAIDADVRSLKIFEELKSDVDLIVLLGDLGVFYRRIGDYDSARSHSLRCLELCSLQPASDPRVVFAKELGLRSAWSNLAWISIRDGDFKTAIAYLTQSMDLSKSRRATYPDWLPDDLIDLSRIYRAMGNYRQAFSCLTEALEITETLISRTQPGASPPPWFARPILNSAYDNLGLLYLYQADYPAAIKWLTLSRDLCTQTNNKRGLAAALSNLGDVYLAQKNTDAALNTYRDALAAAQEVGIPDSIVTIRHGLALAHRAAGDTATALNHLDDAARIAEHIGDKNRLAETYCFKGEVYYSMGDLRTASELADKAYELAEHLSRPRPILWSLSLKGKACTAQQKFDVAREALQQAINTVESVREKIGGDDPGRAQFMEGRWIEPYHLMVDLLLREKDTPGALFVAERAKARALLDILRGGKEGIGTVMTLAEHRRDDELASKLAFLNRQIYAERQHSQPNNAVLAEVSRNLEKARRDYELFRDGLYNAHPEFRAERADEGRFDLKGIEGFGSAEQTAFIEFVVTDNVTHAFVVYWREVKGKKVPYISSYDVNVLANELADSVNAFAERLGNPHIGKEAAAHKLYDLLLAPARDLLSGETSVAIVPDGVLWNLPFQALKESTGKYFADDHSIFYAPSLAVLTEMVKKVQVENDARAGRRVEPNARSTTDGVRETLLAFGNPSLSSHLIDHVGSVYRDERLVPLPDAQREVTALGALYDRARSSIYIGAEAREDRAKAEMSKYRVLHFATHGILDSVSPMYSHIVLSTDDKSPEDGLLEAWEIMRLNLSADLAVLSACDTARGKTDAGEGVIGMSWAFFVAGCPTTVVSQWKVDSASTADLMIEFHKNLVQKSQGPEPRWRKAEALRKAMLTVMKNPKYRDPYYWAGFVVVGAG